MARIIGETKQLSWTEETLVTFLFNQKGKEFSVLEIEKETGIRSDFISPIMDNLRWKGYEVGSRNGKHFFIHNTWKSYLVGGGIFAVMGLIFLMGWLQ